MFRIKVCGVTTAEDARAAGEAGADAVGLNFYPRSKRHISVEQAAEISAALPKEVMRVGVFVDADLGAIEAAHAAVRFDALQLHGHESPEFLRDVRKSALADVPVLRALACGDSLTHVAEYLDRCRQLDCLPRWVMLDAAAAGHPGGTGMTCDWTTAAAYHRLNAAPPLVLAGGLSADNVAEAIAAVRPAAVDVATGVESAPGRKDLAKLRRFIAAARKAFDESMPLSPQP